MPKFTAVRAKFTPAEAHHITGVSPDLQRDWRHRKFLLPRRGRKHVRFDAIELGYLLALKTFSEAGVSIARIEAAAKLAEGPIWAFVSRPAEEYFRAPAQTNVDADASRYVVVRSHKYFPSRVGDLAALEGQPPALLTQIFDCKLAAEVILERTPRPPISFTVTP
jgi:hypothetical protein